jgi:hypothetical protein
VIYYYDQNSAGPKPKINACAQTVAYRESRPPVGAHARTPDLFTFAAEKPSVIPLTRMQSQYLFFNCARGHKVRKKRKEKNMRKNKNKRKE